MGEYQRQPETVKTDIVETVQYAFENAETKGHADQVRASLKGFGDINDSLTKIMAALDPEKFENEDDYKEAKDAFARKLEHALEEFKRVAQDYNSLHKSVEETRDLLERLGVIAQRGPAPYKQPSWMARTFLGKPSQVDQWLEKVRNEPLLVGEKIKQAVQEAKDTAETDAATRAEEREALAALSGGLKLIHPDHIGLSR